MSKFGENFFNCCIYACSYYKIWVEMKMLWLYPSVKAIKPSQFKLLLQNNNNNNYNNNNNKIQKQKQKTKTKTKTKNKQTNRQTNKQTKTNKTKQNKKAKQKQNKNKTKNKNKKMYVNLITYSNLLGQLLHLQMKYTPVLPLFCINGAAFNLKTTTLNTHTFVTTRDV